MRHDVEKDVRIAKRSLEALMKAGADKAQTNLSISEKHEMNIEAGEINLLRTTFNTSLHLGVIKDSRNGQIGISSSDEASIEKAVSDVMDIAAGAHPDEAHDIAERQEPAEFCKGPLEPDLDAMYDRLKSFVATVGQRYPTINLRQVILSFTRSNNYVMNSNGVDFKTFKGIYHFVAMFSASEDDKVSSLNGTGVSMLDLDRELIDCGSVDMLLKQSVEQTATRPIEGKFVGDVIVTPDAFGSIWGFLFGSLTDGPVVSDTSIYKDKVGELVAGPQLTLHCRPVADEIADGYFVTSDGYAAQNSTLIERGVLKGLLLGIYGSRKTGRARAVNQGGAIVVEPGNQSLSDLVRSVKRGILLCRLSGGAPNSYGDFSGVAKNSYLIEDGEIKYPISESMISCNLAEAYKNITGISRERVDFGSSIIPWIALSGVTISGK